jgi:O-antigen ligase
MNHNFSMPIEMHATYLSLYLAFSVLLLIGQWKRNTKRNNKLLIVISIVILLLGMIQLSSRSVCIAFLISLFIQFSFIWTKRKERWIAWGLLALVTIVLLLLIAQVNSFKLRYLTALKTDLSTNVVEVESVEPRMARWHAIAEIVKQSPIIGYGTGTEKKLLQDTYFEHKYFISYLNEFNTHNEYLSILLRVGGLGLLLYLLVLVKMYRTAWKEENLILILLLSIITIVAMSENLFDLNKGIFFYAFFMSILFVRHSAVTENE